MPRYLTKSRFKLASECPTKLFYTAKKIYANTMLDDSFLASLAQGGYQVGELAKLYHPGGHDITTLDYEEALSQTNALLQQDKVVIYEAAIKYQNLFIRIDVLVKTGNHLKLIEVKAKSYAHDNEQEFLTKSGHILSGWRPYLYDVAFQKYVLEHSFPDMQVSSYLMLADKRVACSVDGLNQKFLIVNDDQGRMSVKVSTDITPEDLKTELLCLIHVDHYCQQIMKGEDTKEPPSMSFVERINYFSKAYENDKKISSPISSACAKCEFNATDEQLTNDYKSGFRECWKKMAGWSNEDFLEPSVLDLWNYRGKSHLIEQGQYKMASITEDDINPKPDNKEGKSASERQWLQISKVINKDQSPWIDKEGLRAEMSTWQFPLHFIDFETTMAAIPFNKGRKPYEGIAFQFSHHVVYEDGRIEHAGEYLNAERGFFPNYDFVRALKKALECDNGSIFRYSPHENTYLNSILRQMESDENAIPDIEELSSFIRSITASTKDSIEKWTGDRNMIDLWIMVKRYYYDPHTNGSNSIKAVLPAILNSSSYLQEKYSQPIYGATNGISSLNFKDWIWLQKENGVIKDPYKLLPKVFDDVSDADLERLTEDDELKDGGAAMTAYARMQFEEMSDVERQKISSALLKYCELDTLAMVMIYEGWREFLKLR